MGIELGIQTRLLIVGALNWTNLIFGLITYRERRQKKAPNSYN